MEAVLNEIYNIIMSLISGSNFFGPLLACLLILVESMIPILPLFVFITILFISYGYILGFILSYILTCLGCLLSFYIFRHLLKDSFEKKLRSHERINRLMKIVDKISITKLVLLIAIPFTPAFLINIIAGLSKIDFKKYLVSILIGKISLVIFWGFIGTSLLESLRNPKIMVIIFVMLFISYIISKHVTRIVKFE